MVNEVLHDSDLLLLLQKKCELLQQLLWCSQQQIALVDLSELPPFLKEKDAYIAQLSALDQLLEQWLTKHQRSLLQGEVDFQSEIVQLLSLNLNSEQQFEKRLQKEKTLITREMRQLQNQARYVGSKRTQPIHTSIRKKTSY